MSDHILREDIYETCVELMNEILDSDFKITVDGEVVYKKSIVEEGDEKMDK